MAKLDDIGNLMYLYLDDIKVKHLTEKSFFLISATAKLLHQNQTRNWLPLIVKETGEDQYELIANSFAYQVAKEANLERVWCIIADGSQETSEISQILMGEKIPKINLSTASKEEISQAIEYLFSLPNIELKSIRRYKQKLIDNISSSPIRKYWKNLKPIGNLRCGIGNRGKKLNELAQVFYLTPESIPMDTTDKNILNNLTLTELRDIAKARKLKKYSNLKISQLVDLLSCTS
ncbi:MAG: Rho termination factor [Cyanobacterium sp.]